LDQRLGYGSLEKESTGLRVSLEVGNYFQLGRGWGNSYSFKRIYQLRVRGEAYERILARRL